MSPVAIRRRRAGGGVQIDRADLAANQGPFTNSSAAPVDIPGMQIVVPAGTGPYVVKFVGTLSLLTLTGWTSAAGYPQPQIELVDEANVSYGVFPIRPIMTAAAQTVFAAVNLEWQMAATATAKTLRLRIGLGNGTTNMQTVVWSKNSNIATSFMQAIAR